MTSYKLSTTNLPGFTASLNRHAIGFDNLFNELSRTHLGNSKADNYPPYNIIKVDEHNWAIQVAVAGFGENELNIEFETNVLTITGEKQEAEEHEYLHKGISARTFTRTFTLNENVKIKGATVVNGILAVSLEHIVPEEQKPKKIAITFTK
jgi:molecular chaperone IbpA